LRLSRRPEQGVFARRSFLRVASLAAIGEDFAAQATISNVLENNGLIAEAAREAGIP
jgi:hypothetical protein